MDSPARFRRWVEPVIIGLITMAIAALLLASWQFVFKGGIVKSLGGVTASQLESLLDGTLSDIEFWSGCNRYEADEYCGEEYERRTAPACPKDHSLVTPYDNSWVGGECGFLVRCNLCVRLSRGQPPEARSD